MMRIQILIVAASAALLLPALSAAQEYVRPLDRIYGPRHPSDVEPAARRPGVGQPAGPAAGAAARRSGTGAGVSGGTAVGRPRGDSGVGTSAGRTYSGTTAKPAGPRYRGGMVGTRPRMSRSPSLGGARR